VGGVRTALFNYLFARHNGGVFILRIDDTDPVRSKPEHLQNIKESLRWLGMDWDEGPDIGGPRAPYFQSEKPGRYAEAAAKMLAEGKAFHCYCTAEELEAKRQQAARLKAAPRYDGRCLALSASERDAFVREGRKPAVRLRLEEGPPLVLDDVIRGRIEFPRGMFDHFILVRSDGKPVYNFVSAIDDADHGITHVIRGDDHLSNTPKHMLVASALGFPVPRYAHLPQILGLDRARLSKRHGAPGVLELRDEGFLPSAILNFLALLGWSFNDHDELFSLAELIEKFDLGRVGSAPAVFDETKLSWMNGHYIRQDVTGAIYPELERRVREAFDTPAARDQAYVAAAIRLVLEGLKTTIEVVPATEFFFRDEIAWEEQARKKLMGWPGVAGILAGVKALVAGAEPFTPDRIEALYREGAEKAGLKFKDYVHPTRFAVTGRVAGPSLFHLMEVLGRDRCLVRLAAAETAVKAG
jgi:glutamyl-tRNA synthetase